MEKFPKRNLPIRSDLLNKDNKDLSFYKVKKIKCKYLTETNISVKDPSCGCPSYIGYCFHPMKIKDEKPEEIITRRCNPLKCKFFSRP